MAQDNLIETEIWKYVPGFENMYQVSNLGKVRSCDRTITCCNKNSYQIKGQEMSLNDNGHGYLFIHLSKNNHRQKFYIHRLVMLTFVGECPFGYEIDHINGNKADNRLCNLRYVTHKENINNPITLIRNKIAAQKNVRKYYKPVLMYDNDGNFICEFESVKACSNYFGMKNTAAATYIKYKCRCRGYWLKYK